MALHNFQTRCHVIIGHNIISKTNLLIWEKRLSDFLTVSVVPQGSILSLSLFLIFNNDHLFFLNKSSYALYADDTTIHTHNINIIENDVQTECGNAQNWSKYSYKENRQHVHWD